MQPRKFLTSGLTFSANEYDLKSRLMAINVLLLITSALLSVMSVIRFSSGNYNQAAVNLMFCIFSITGICWIRGGKKRIPIVTRTTCLAGLIVITAIFINVPQDNLRIGWFLVLVVPAFFLCGARFASLLSLFSLLIVCAIHLTFGSNYSNYDIFYFADLLFIISIFLYFYEYRSSQNRERLQLLNSQLEDKVQTRTDELKKANKELQLYFHALETSFDSVVVTNMEGRIFYINKAAAKLSGYTKEEANGQSVDIFCSHIHFGSGQLIPSLQKNNHQEIEIVTRRKDHSNYPSLASITTIFDKKHAPLGILFIFKDLTEIKEAEKQRIELEKKLYQTKKMEAMGHMASAVAHDLNNILSGIVTYPDLILKELPADSNLCSYVRDIRTSGWKASAVVSDLLTIARGAASTREEHDLNILIRNFFQTPEGKELLVRKPNITYTIQCAENLHPTHCSIAHISNCLTNLVSNAFEAIEDKGEVTLSTENFSLSKSINQRHDLEPGDYVLLTVTDSGSGISDKDLAHIFEPFYSKKFMGRSGSGLGLAIVWNTVEDHDGRVIVKTSTNSTSFQLFFPVTTQNSIQSHPVNTTPENAARSGDGQTILVVDDEEIPRRMTSHVLKSLNYKIHALGSGEEAVSYIKQNPVDLVILDMLMEPGINGYETYKQMQQIRPQQKAIVISAYSDNIDVEKTLKLGASFFLQKPYDLPDIATAVFNTLDGSNQ
jgi:PAS domain S-box-containing protein